MVVLMEDIMLEIELHNTQDLPCFGALLEGKTPTAALAYPLIMGGNTSTRCSLSCMQEQWWSSLEKKS